MYIHNVLEAIKYGKSAFCTVLLGIYITFCLFIEKQNCISLYTEHNA